MNIKDYKSIVNIHIRYDDLDTYKHVNNKAFLSFLEEARIKYFVDINGKMPDGLYFGAVVASINIKYIAPVFITDQVAVLTRCSRIGNKSYDLHHLIVKKIKGKQIIAAEANVTLVSYDLQKNTTVPLADHWKQKVIDFEIIKPELKNN